MNAVASKLSEVSETLSDEGSDQGDRQPTASPPNGERRLLFPPLSDLDVGRELGRLRRLIARTQRHLEVSSNPTSNGSAATVPNGAEPTTTETSSEPAAVSVAATEGDVEEY